VHHLLIFRQLKLKFLEIREVEGTKSPMTQQHHRAVKNRDEI
jgi:hypothetical protein